MLDDAEVAAPRTKSYRLPVDGLRLHVLEYAAAGPGDGARPGGNVLLLHGGMAHARWWDFVAPLLAPVARVFALDRRGHGDSDWAPPDCYGWGRDLLDTETAMAVLDDRPWTLVGHSQGGLQAVSLALRGNAAIRALVLVDVPLHPASRRLMKAGRSFTRIRQVRYPSLEAAVRGFRPFPMPHHIPEPLLRYIARASFKPSDDGAFTSKFDWQVFQQNHRARENPLADFPGQVASLPMPALALRGDESTILTADDHAQMVASLRKGTGRVVPHATHSLHAEAPDAVAGAIREFLLAL
jgi:pimeloyl-ACP methyl ester carboxylesterase